MGMDAIDSAAIELLQQDGRISYSDMAKQLGVARSSISDRVGELIESGQIKIVAAVHPLVLGLRSIAHVSIRVNGEISAVTERLAQIESVVFLSESVGHFHVFAELRAAEPTDIAREIDTIRGVPGVAFVEVMLYEEILQSLFHERGEIDDDFQLDEHDLAILTELQRDGRLSFGALGEQVGLSTSATRKRVLRLLDHNIMRIGAIQRRTTESHIAALHGLGLTLSRRGEDLIELLREQAGVEFLARTIGRFSVVASLSATNAELAELIHRLRQHPGVLNVESWLHAEVKIERYERRMVLS